MRVVRRVAVRLVVACACVAAGTTVSAAQDAGPIPRSEAPRAALLPTTWAEPGQRGAAAGLAAVPAPPSRRPGALLPLYAGLVTLQALDIHSTYSALASAGAREANPVMAPVVKNRAVFTAVKASSTAGLLWATETMWKKNRKAAVIFAVAANAGMALVVSHNYRVAARAK